MNENEFLEVYSDDTVPYKGGVNPAIQPGDAIDINSAYPSTAKLVENSEYGKMGEATTKEKEQFEVWLIYHTLGMSNGVVFLAVCSTEEKANAWIHHAPILDGGEYGIIPAIVDDDVPYGLADDEVKSQ